MKLILTQEVTGLGAPGDVVEVKDGYGRNFLVPRGLAALATRGAEKQVATIRRARDVREVRDLGHANEIKQALQTLIVTLPARAGDGGKLFGSVTAADVVAAVTKAGGPKLDKRSIVIKHAIKALGSHSVQVKVHADVEVNLPVLGLRPFLQARGRPGGRANGPAPAREPGRFVVPKVVIQPGLWSADSPRDAGPEAKKVVGRGLGRALGCRRAGAGAAAHRDRDGHRLGDAPDRDGRRHHRLGARRPQG